jgi:phosphohistidine phosphatase
MKTLLVMRHAKSSWKDSDLVDHDRPLNKRGKRDAPRIGELLRQERLVPELVLTSSARRAQDTAEAVVEASGYIPEIRHLPSFYQADLETVYETLQHLPGDIDRVMIVGHNPELEALVEALTGEQVPLPTATVVVVSLPIEDWQELDEETQGKMVKMWVPREID